MNSHRQTWRAPPGPRLTRYHLRQHCASQQVQFANDRSGSWRAGAGPGPL